MHGGGRDRHPLRVIAVRLNPIYTVWSLRVHCVFFPGFDVLKLPFCL